ncbi:magnesium transporter [Fibrobacterota bacterium]
MKDRSDLEKNSVLLLIGDYLDEKNYPAILELIKESHPADVAFVLNLLEDEDSCQILKLLDDEIQAEIIPELNDGKRQYMAEHLQHTELSQIVEEMESDDAADLVGLLDETIQEQVLESVEEEDAREVRELLQHEEDTAGGLMSKEVVAIEHNATVERAISEIRKAVEETEQIYNVFVVEGQTGELLGTLSLDTLVLAKPNTRVSELMEEIRSVTTAMDQEEVANLAKKYDLVEVPVVDEGNRLVGRITHDDILDVLEEEIEEDIGKMAGTGDEDVHGHSALEVSRKRLTWLVVGLFGGIVAAFIMSRFELALGKILLLAFFVPVIMAMGGIVGLQSSTITVRGLATGEIIQGQIAKRVMRELSISMITGTLCSLLLAVLIILWQGEVSLGMVVGMSMFCVMLMSTFSGTFIPVVLSRLDIDPAIATGPFVTTLNDILGLGVYFLLTTLLLDI